MTDTIKPIDDMPILKKHLGKAKTDRIRYSQLRDDKPEPNSTNIRNTVLIPMQYKNYKVCDPLFDILYGVANLGENKSHDKFIPLNVERLYTILQCMQIINTREVTKMMGINKRQAQRYVKAIKIAMPFIIKYFKEQSNDRSETFDG